MAIPVTRIDAPKFQAWLARQDSEAGYCDSGWPLGLAVLFFFGGILGAIALIVAVAAGPLSWPWAFLIPLTYAPLSLTFKLFGWADDAKVKNADLKAITRTYNQVDPVFEETARMLVLRCYEMVDDVESVDCDVERALRLRKDRLDRIIRDQRQKKVQQAIADKSDIEQVDILFSLDKGAFPS